MILKKISLRTKGIPNDVNNSYLFTAQSLLLQTLLNVVQHLRHQVQPVLATHIVWVHRVWEEIHLYPSIDEGFYETEVVLHHYDIVHGAVDEKEVALEVAHVVVQAVFCIAILVFFGTVHVALAVHDFIVFPIGHRATGHTRFEGARLAKHE